MSADKCPVCGAERVADEGPDGEFDCGKSMVFNDQCGHAERLAIERGKEIAKLQGRLAKARKIILLHVPDDVGPIAAIECGEWVTWCAGYLESKGVSHE